jgi:hypothetical protein
MKRILTLLSLVLLLRESSSAQNLGLPLPSPPQLIKQDFGLSTIELSYSRPGVKGRKIFGDLVPFGKIWRTGANQATTIQFGDEVIIDGHKIPAGKYGLLTIPGASEWTVIISKQLDVTSPSAYKQDQDELRVTAKVQELPFSVESFTMDFGSVTTNTCILEFIWDKTWLGIPLRTDIDARIMARIDSTLKAGGEQIPYYSAALYYLDNGKDLNKALAWFEKAGQQDPKGYFIFYQKARCQAKLGMKKEAIQTARQSSQLAKDAGNEDYIKLNDKLIESLQ